jgi:pyruvate dehydrogenase E1 component alpha subunit/2-oxoisovalerate dehydrogenase E1 component alpha subunit
MLRTEEFSDTGLYQLLDDDGHLIEGRDIPEGMDAVGCYRWMLLTRILDSRMVNLQRQGRIAFYGPITGQEAGTIASGLAAGEQDWVFPALREGALAIVRGLPLARAVAQFFGNALDDCMGRQMPCHPTYVDRHFVAMSSCIGTQIPHAVGAAMAAKIRRDKVVVLGYLGDGATSEPDFHCAMNSAGVTKAPVVLICQNNQWAISVPVSRQSASETIAIKARAYGIEGVRVDGNDALAVYGATCRAVDKARRGEGPTFLELVTYRLLGHTTSDDPTRYRSEDEVEAWQRKDPLRRMRVFLEDRGLWDEQREKAASDEINAEITRAVEEAEKAGEPAPETLFDDVYATVPWHLREQREGLMARRNAHG